MTSKKTGNHGVSPAPSLRNLPPTPPGYQDHHPHWMAELRRVRALWAEASGETEEGRRLWEEGNRLDALIRNTPVRTLAGTVAQMAWQREFGPKKETKHVG